MKQFLTVLKFELNNYFKNKSFVITTLILAFIIAGVVIIPTIIPGFLDNESGEKEPGISEEIIPDDNTNSGDNNTNDDTNNDSSDADDTFDIFSLIKMLIEFIKEVLFNSVGNKNLI